jgi:hypothetical protein
VDGLAVGLAVGEEVGSSDEQSLQVNGQTLRWLGFAQSSRLSSAQKPVCSAEAPTLNASQIVVGPRDGLLVGLREVGLSDGDVLGEADGLLVGNFDGLPVGVDVVGLSVGEPVGVVVGDGVGYTLQRTGQSARFSSFPQNVAISSSVMKKSQNAWSKVGLKDGLTDGVEAAARLALEGMKTTRIIKATAASLPGRPQPARPAAARVARVIIIRTRGLLDPFWAAARHGV